MDINNKLTISLSRSDARILGEYIQELNTNEELINLLAQKLVRVKNVSPGSKFNDKHIFSVDEGIERDVKMFVPVNILTQIAHEMNQKHNIIDNNDSNELPYVVGAFTKVILGIARSVDAIINDDNQNVNNDVINVIDDINQKEAA